jgi:YVTN family beta-propeller protein
MKHVLNRISRPILPALLAAAALIAVPARSQTPVATVATLPNPFVIVANPVTNKIYVLSFQTAGKVTEIDGATNATTSIAVGTNPKGMAVNTVTNKIYVSNSGDNTVTEIDGATRATTTIPTDLNPAAVAVNMVTNKIYVVDEDNDINGRVTVIDGATRASMTIAKGISPGPHAISPQALAIDSGANKIYVNDPQNSEVAVIDGATNEVTDVTGMDGAAVVADSVRKLAFVANIQDGYTVAIRSADLSTVNIPGGQPDLSIAVNAVTGNVFVIESGAPGTLQVIDEATLTSVTLVPAGNNPLDVAVNTVTNKIYIADGSQAGVLTVVDGVTFATSSFPVGANPFAVAVNEATNRIYVLNNDANGTVSVFDGTTQAAAPTVTSQPQSQTINTGVPVVFTASAGGSPSPTYQWSLNGTPLSDGNGISGSTTSTLFISGSATSANAGSYTFTAANASGSVTSSAATLTVAASATPGRLVNLSTRGYVVAPGGLGETNPLFAGFVIGGTGSKTVVLRAVGPALAAFGVTGTFPAPSLTLFDAATIPNQISEDVGWQNAPTVPSGVWAGKASPADATAADFSQVGAFALPAGSADSAIRVTLPSGGYTSEISGMGGVFGVCLAEVYDEDPPTSGTELVNISTRAFVGDGDYALIAGFVISGNTSETVLIRASGPALAAFVANTLPDPQVALFDSSQNQIGFNLSWGGNPQISSAAASVGAFAWTDPASHDSALLVTLPPGGYTAQVSSTSDTGGAALVEVYVLH